MVEDLTLEPQAKPEGEPRHVRGTRPGGELSQTPAAKRARKSRANKGKTRRAPRPANPLSDAAPGGRPSRASKANADALQAIGGMLMMANGGLAMVAPDDVLSDAEIEALAKALLEDPWTGGPLTKVKAFAHAPLIMIAISIAVSRLVRHGIIPDSVFNPGTREYAITHGLVDGQPVFADGLVDGQPVFADGGPY